MAKKQKRPRRSKRSIGLLTGGLVLLVAVGGIYLFAQSRPVWGSLSAIGQGKPVVVEVFLPT